MLNSTNNHDFAEPLKFREYANLHTEHWQGLHIAFCRLLQVLPQHPAARLRYAHSGDWYAIEWSLDNSPLSW